MADVTGEDKTEHSVSLLLLFHLLQSLVPTYLLSYLLHAHR